MSYQISVLDKSPVAEGASPEQALRNSLQLAQRAEQLGYHRYWFAEHHAAPTLASPAPEVLAAWVLAQTRRIRIGSGGVMLRHYAPYKVAENFNLLAALAPGAWIWAWARRPAACRPRPPRWQPGVRRSPTSTSNCATWRAICPAPKARRWRGRFRSRRRSASCSAPARRAQSRRPNWAGASSTPRTSMATEAHRGRVRRLPQRRLAATAAGHGGLRRTDCGSRSASYRCAARLQAAPRSRAGGEPAQPEAAAEYARQVGVADFRIEETRPSVLSGDAQHVRGELDALHRRFGVGEFILDAPVADLDARLTSLELLSPAPRARWPDLQERFP
jgi:alkanesulfonate monooxygenase SsuD/methylene tetrahydromethanopterin reductase-like flavin-dependent oxidoreductase (luciferase family)